MDVLSWWLSGPFFIMTAPIELPSEMLYRCNQNYELKHLSVCRNPAKFTNTLETPGRGGMDEEVKMVMTSQIWTIDKNTQGDEGKTMDGT